MKLADVSIRRPVFAVMLIGGLVVLGLVSIPRLGIDLYPRIEFPLVVVETVLPGAAPETVEQEVTEVLGEDGYVDLAASGSLALTGLEGYHEVGPPIRLPYARPPASSDPTT